MTYKPHLMLSESNPKAVCSSGSYRIHSGYGVSLQEFIERVESGKDYCKRCASSPTFKNLLKKHNENRSAA